MIFDKNKLLLIAGPCAIENRDMAFLAAECLSNIKKTFPELNIIFKSSFDKANRNSIHGGRGVGIKEGLQILSAIKSQFNFRILTDIHLPDQAEAVSEVCDIIQIPAFLCRQTDLLLAAASTGKTISVKKGQFLSPYDMKYIVEKLESARTKEIWQIERGSTFGYNNLVVDMRSIPIMKKNKHPVIFDATHSVQLPGANSGQSGGERQFVHTLANAALAAGADGLFFEIHPNPELAICDKDTQIALENFPKILTQCVKIWNAARNSNEQEKYLTFFSKAL